MVPAAHIQALTFDCYGTLIDWDNGIRTGLEGLASLAGCDFDRLLADREREEYALLKPPFKLYGEVLAASLRAAARLQEREVSDDEAARFVAGMGDWPPFADARESLARLATRFRLAIVSNVETTTLERSIAQLGVAFQELVTAEQVRSYKPDRVHFDEALFRLDLPRERVLHVAGSLYHDIRPVHELGWSAVWINRRAEELDADLSGVASFKDLPSLAKSLGV